MGTLIMIGQFMLGLSILVGIHELGHMLFAKWFGMRVEKFSIGFGPVIFWVQGKETKYQFCAIPLGGFVKILGMVDESLDTDKLDQDPEEWEFRAKPAWQRLLVMLGGIIFNVILGCMIFTGIKYHYGAPHLPFSKMKHGLYVPEYFQELGMKNGDIVTQVNGQDVKNYEELLNLEPLLEENSSYTVLRNGESILIPFPDTLLSGIKKSKSGLPSVDGTYEVVGISKESVAERSRVKVGDKLLAINGDSVLLFSQLRGAIQKNKGQDITLTVLREKDTLSLNGTLGNEGILGVESRIDSKGITEIEYFSFGESIVLGSKEAMNQLVMTVKSLGLVFQGRVDVRESFTGLTGIARLYGDEFKPSKFWSLCGMLSMALAFFNLVPIPGLDGGHVMFLLYEIVLRRKPSVKFQEVALKIGFIILITLMVLVNGNEIFNLLR